MATEPIAIADTRIVREEREAFERATKISPSEYQGAVLWPGDDYPPGDMSGGGWFSSVDAVIRECAEDGREPPEYLWTGTAVGVSIDAGSVIEFALAEHHEDAADWLAPGAEAALQAGLDTWVKAYARDVKTWQQDRRRAVVIGDAERERYRALRAEFEADCARFIEEG